MSSKRVSVFADYHQFYVMDLQSGGPDPMAISTDTLLQRVMCGGDHLAVFTLRNMHVPVVVDVLPEAPELDVNGWDHVVDGALTLPSGRLVILGCTDPQEDAEAMDIAPGTYRLRVSMAGLEDLSANGLDGGDHYRVQLWPGPWRETVVRKIHLAPV